MGEDGKCVDISRESRGGRGKGEEEGERGNILPQLHGARHQQQVCCLVLVAMEMGSKGPDRMVESLNSSSV